MAKNQFHIIMVKSTFQGDGNSKMKYSDMFYLCTVFKAKNDGVELHAEILANLSQPF